MEEEAAMARSLGFHVRLLGSVAPTGRPGLLFPAQMKFHPLKYLHALAAEAQRVGVRIHELSDVSEFRENVDVAKGWNADFALTMLCAAMSTFSRSLLRPRLVSSAIVTA